jgi:Protein of unknown function (DUF2892)
MNDNVSPIDQWIRIIVGVMAAWEYLLQPQGRVWLLFFSAFFFLSGMLGRCPLYTLIGVGTKQNAKARDDGKRNVKVP